MTQQQVALPQYLEAYAQGWYHRQALGLRCECPFPVGTESHEAWNKGYADSFKAERTKTKERML